MVRPPNSKGRYSEGEFLPANPEKCLNSGKIFYRSSWELNFMNKCDTNPAIMQWASEAIKIPYYNMITKKQTIYIPDFLIQYVDANNKVHIDLIEIKPLNQTIQERARGVRNKVQLAINTCKWKAAHKWCKKHGMGFKIITEADLFPALTGRRKRKR